MMNLKNLNLLLALAVVGSMGNILAEIPGAAKPSTLSEESLNQQEAIPPCKSPEECGKLIRKELYLLLETKDLRPFIEAFYDKAYGMTKERVNRLEEYLETGIWRSIEETPQSPLLLEAKDIKPLIEALITCEGAFYNGVYGMTKERVHRLEEYLETGVWRSLEEASQSPLSKEKKPKEKKPQQPVNAWSKKKIGLALLLAASAYHNRTNLTSIPSIVGLVYLGRTSLKSMITSFWK